MTQHLKLPFARHWRNGAYGEVAFRLSAPTGHPPNAGKVLAVAGLIAIIAASRSPPDELPAPIDLVPKGAASAPGKSRSCRSLREAGARLRSDVRAADSDIQPCLRQLLPRPPTTGTSTVG